MALVILCFEFDNFVPGGDDFVTYFWLCSASVFSTALFPQGNCTLPVRSFHRRCAFLRGWIKAAMDYLD